MRLDQFTVGRRKLLVLTDMHVAGTMHAAGSHDSWTLSLCRLVVVDLAPLRTV